jgi:transposase
MQEATLFPGTGIDVDGRAEAKKRTPDAAPRLRRPDRAQVLMQPVCLEEMLAADHPARTIWAVVARLDLSQFQEDLEARGSDPGRPATDPQLLVALWLYAAVDGVGSGRELERLCGCHDAYRWLCGGVAVNYHTLNDFRLGHGAALDALFTQVLGVLMAQGAVRVQRVSQDGTRVRAAAGSGSFRRRQTLQDHLEAARRQVADLKRQMDEPSEASAQRQAARARAARERLARVEAALAELQKIEEAKARQKKKPSKDRPARASTTDPEARVMKMGNGGFNPAHNVQFGADPESRAILGVAVSQAGSDANLDEPMRKQIEERTGQKVEEQLMDGGFVTLDGIDRATAEGIVVYAPPPTPRKAKSPCEVRKGDSPAVAAWRQRMGTPEAKAIYKKRAAISETVNADLKTFRGLARLLVRGVRKVKCVALWCALAYNVMHFASVLIG